MDELAGLLGINPDPCTLRQLLVMAEARIQDQWNHTASVLAMLANIHRDAKKSRPFKPADFHPHRKSIPPTVTKVGIDVLKQVFVDRPSEV